jgi:hypothetical protein
MASIAAPSENPTVFAAPLALIAALAAAQSDRGHLCYEQAHAHIVEHAIVEFRTARGYEPASIAELADAGYLRTPPNGPDGRPLWPADRELTPLVIAMGSDGRAHVAREGGAAVATSWECHREDWVFVGVSAVVLASGIAASGATRRWRFALLAVALIVTCAVALNVVS